MNKPVAFQIVNGELCYKSKADDQSFGMWCPVNYDTEYEHEEGAKFYTEPPPQFTAEQLQSVLDALFYGQKAQSELAMLYVQSNKGSEFVDEALLNRSFTQKAIALLKGKLE